MKFNFDHEDGRNPLLTEDNDLSKDERVETLCNLETQAALGFSFEPNYTKENSPTPKRQSVENQMSQVFLLLNGIIE